MTEPNLTSHTYSQSNNIHQP